MAAGTIDAAVDCQEGFSSELAGETYRIMRHLARGPQDERFYLTRAFGIGFPQKTEAELMSEMNLDSDQFEALRKRALRRLREAQRG